jgi:hypothetical protein
MSIGCFADEKKLRNHDQFHGLPDFPTNDGRYFGSPAKDYTERPIK